MLGAAGSHFRPKKGTTSSSFSGDDDENLASMIWMDNWAIGPVQWTASAASAASRRSACLCAARACPCRFCPGFGTSTCRATPLRELLMGRQTRAAVSAMPENNFRTPRNSPGDVQGGYKLTGGKLLLESFHPGRFKFTMGNSPGKKSLIRE